jgi:hypothetical protein
MYIHKDHSLPSHASLASGLFTTRPLGRWSNVSDYVRARPPETAGHMGCDEARCESDARGGRETTGTPCVPAASARSIWQQSTARRRPRDMGRVCHTRFAAAAPRGACAVADSPAGRPLLVSSL